jgi:Mce-associated membrane protein
VSTGIDTARGADERDGPESPDVVESLPVDEAAGTEAVPYEDDEEAGPKESGAELMDASGAKALARWRSPRGIGAVVGTMMIVVLAALVGWLGFRAYQSHQANAQRELFLQVGRQGAINLTTIDFTQADADVARILNSATGTFYADFSKRSKPFTDVVKQAHSKSVGTVTAAGVESESADQAKVLVAVSVTTSNAGAPAQDPRAWRMRIFVQKTGDQAKISNVEFVP